MKNSYTYQPDYSVKDGRYFGLVQIILGSRMMNPRVIRLARNDKEAALQDAHKLARAMFALGVNCEINLNDYN